MTAQDLAERAMGNLDQPRAQLDPISITILLAILGAVITHYVERCLDDLDHRTVSNPGRIAKWRLWLDCLWAADKDKRATRHHVTLAYNALLKTGAQMTEADLEALRSK